MHRGGDDPPAAALRAIRAWVRLEQAFAAFNRHLRATTGLTGAQLAMLRIIAELAPVTLAQLRSRLVLHPATLGQLVDRLVAKGLVTVAPDPADGRRRLVGPTGQGRRVLAAAPVAGPVRLRTVPAEPARLTGLADALDDAVELFGLRRLGGGGNQMSKVDVLGLDNVLLDVGDLEAARGFYGGRLGLGVKFDFPEAGIVGFRLGDEEPGLLVRAGDVPPGPPRPSPRLWLEVPDAQAAGAALAAAGVALLGEPRELRTGWVVEVADPWGNVIGLTDYRHTPERARRRAGAPSS